MRSVTKNIGVGWRCANLYRAAKFEKIGIGCYQYSYILQVCKAPGIAQEKLSKRMYIHKSNVARQLASLEEKGFITRKTDPEDRRSLLVYPTNKAIAALPQIRAVLEEWESLLLEEFSEEEQKTLLSFSERLAARAAALAEMQQEEEE